MTIEEKKEEKCREKEEKKKCVFCKDNLASQATFLIFIIIAAFLFYQYYIKINTYNEDGVEYSISKKIFTLDNIFYFKIKNTKNIDKQIKYKDMIFEIFNEKDIVIYYKTINFNKDKLMLNEEYEEEIKIDKKLKFGNYKALVYLDTQTLKKVETKFFVR